MERDEFLRGMQEAAERLRERAASVHERVACPRCGAVLGDRCHRAGALYIAGYAGYVPPAPLKHPHRERLRADGIPDR
jgi:predicted RNA-binding Zn-ribbon protein involved in translation (DUF1610 family)